MIEGSMGTVVKSVIASALMLLALAGAAWADDRIYEDLSGSEIVALLDAHGYDATLTTDTYGDPFITARGSDLKFKVLTSDCDKAAPRRCRSLMFLATFALPRKATDEDFRAMNEYNKNKMFGRAFIDDNGDAAVDFVINMSGGVSARNLMDNVGTWKVYVLDVFVKHLGWQTS